MSVLELQCHSPCPQSHVKGEVVRYESKCCLLMHYTGKQKSFSRDRWYNMCTECKGLDSHLVQYASNAAEVSGETKIARTLPSLNYHFSYLSPTSQKVRARKLMRNETISTGRLPNTQTSVSPLIMNRTNKWQRQ